MTGIELAYSQEKNLHPLAQKSVNATRMFQLPDEKNASACRSFFGRDRDRIIFCKSFRRLAHKTQLYISHEGNEHNRTRLTHTIEVAQIAKTIARNLLMNEELVEAISFGHDVGHSPFGHAGERQINRFLKGMEPYPRRVKERIVSDEKQEEDIRGDFRHNYQSVRILAFLEKYHPNYEGMNLTVQCLEGILKHTKMTPLINTGKPFNFPGISDENGIFSKLAIDKPYSISIEGQIVSIADDIAQVTHDVNDALRLGTLSVDALLKYKSIQTVSQKDKMRFPKSIENCKDPSDRLHSQITSAFINHFMRYVILKLKKKIDRINPSSKVAQGKEFKLDQWLFPDNKIRDEAYEDLKKIKDDIVLNNFTVNRMDTKGEYFIRNLFEAYLNNPRQLPDSILDAYCQIKKKEIKRLGKLGFRDWFIKKQKQYKITEHLSDRDMKNIISFLKEETAGREFRLLPHQLIDNILPYLVIDSDFIRAIADHISSMTDKYAKQEYESLYL
jgi:dGTPase